MTEKFKNYGNRLAENRTSVKTLLAEERQMCP